MLEKCDSDNIRLDVYLSKKLDFSRSKVQKMINSGNVLVNGEVENANHKLKIADEIKIDFVDENITIEAENIEIDVVYEDDDLVIVNKKSGMVVHPAPGNYHATLVNALLYRFNLSNKDKTRPGIVHRIDKDTSGLLIVAKNDWAHDKLADMIKNKLVERTYVALVEGVIKHETGTIDAPIGRDEANRQKMAVTSDNSKDAITHFRVLKRYSDNTLVECKLETGRTHQIRVHFNYIGYPIVNDPLYGKGKKQTPFGQLLHSSSIKFNHPRNNKEIYFEADLPDEFQSFLNNLD